MRHLRLVIVVLAVAGVASPVAAQGWGRGWFEKWSGPGAFYGTDVRLAIGCVAREPGTPLRFEPLWTGRDESGTAGLCLDAEFSAYANEDNDRARHGVITFDRYQLLAMYILPGNFRGAVEIGAGVGSITFHGGTFEFDRKFMPLRATIKPLRIAVRPDEARRPILGILQVAGTLLVFPEAVRHQDFNIIPVRDEDNFSHHFHPNITVILDFSSFLFNR